MGFVQQAWNDTFFSISLDFFTRQAEPKNVWNDDILEWPHLFQTPQRFTSKAKLSKQKPKKKGKSIFSIIGHDFSFRTNRHFEF